MEGLKNIYVIIDSGHGEDTPGKCSPDRRLLEYKWCRKLAQLLSEELTGMGISNTILVPEQKDIPLAQRVKRANDIYTKNKNKECCLISIHNNAAGNGNWMNASGWTVWVANTASPKTKLLAKCLYNQCEKFGLQGNRIVPKEKYWSAGFYILKNTKMPAVLTENMFQDNKEDVEYLLSDKGIMEILQLHTQGIVEWAKQL